MSNDIKQKLRQFGVTSGRILREDIYAAADRIEALEAEVARLRAALKLITLSYGERRGIDPVTIAQDALKEEAGE